MAPQNYPHFSRGPRDLSPQVSRFHFLKWIYKQLVLSHMQLAFRVSFQIGFLPPCTPPHNILVSKYLKAKRHLKAIACLELRGLRFRPPGWAICQTSKLWVCPRSLMDQSMIKLRQWNISGTPQENEPWYQQENQNADTYAYVDFLCSLCRCTVITIWGNYKSGMFFNFTQILQGTREGWTVTPF